MSTHTALTHHAQPLASAPEPEPDLGPRGRYRGSGPARLLDADDIAVLLGVPRTYVYALARRGAIPTVRVGERYVRFRAEAIAEWIAAQESTRPRGTR